MTQRQTPQTNLAELEAKGKKSTFVSQGTTCAATLYLPDKPKKQRLPAILMIGGWGSVQLALTLPFVSRFVAAGYAVMEFDFIGWGRSAGWPRQAINPWQRVATANAALAHLKSQPTVDAENIVLWGTSFGGGHVVDLANQLTDIKGAIAQVPMLDGRATALAVPPTRMLRFGGAVLKSLVNRNHSLPTLAAPGEWGTMDRDGAQEALNLGMAALPSKHYVNHVTARSLVTMGFYRPIKRLPKIKFPLLIVGATGDTVAPFVADHIKRINNPNVRLVSLDANHFDPYFEPLFSQTIKAELDFIKEILPF